MSQTRLYEKSYFPEAFGKPLFQFHLAKNYSLPSLSWCMFQEMACASWLGQSSYRNQCQVETGLPLHQSVPHLKLVVVDILLVFGRQMERMDTRSSIPKSSFLKKMNKLNIKEIQWFCQADAFCLKNLKWIKLCKTPWHK